MDGSFLSRHQKKRGVENKLLVLVVLVLVLFALEEERRRRDGGREKRAEKSKPGRDGDAEAEKNASVAWSRGRRFFERGKERIRAFVFYFFVVPEFSLSSINNAHCVLLRETIARTLPLWEEHRRRRRRWVPGGRKTLREAGERDERRGTEWSRRSDGDDGHRGGCHGASDGGIIIIICAKETIESNFRERGGEKTHGRASVETKTRRDEEEQQTDEREREQVERRE